MKKCSIITGILIAFGLLASGLAAQTVSKQRLPQAPTTEETIQAAQWAEVIRSLNKENADMEVTLPNGLVYVRKAIPESAIDVKVIDMNELKSKGMEEPSLFSTASGNDIPWRLESFVAYDYVQGMPWRWVYGATAKYRHKTTGETKTVRIYDNACLYLIPFSQNILGTVFEGMMGSIYSIILSTALMVCDIDAPSMTWYIYEEHTDTYQLWEVVYWAKDGGEYEDQATRLLNRVLSYAKLP